MTDYLHDRVVAAVGDQYLIEGEIGRGGMAAVFRALDLRLHRRVAIKALPPELAFNTDVKTRFLREAQTAAQLSHQNIVPIYSVDERGGVVYFVMALVEGESLAARLARQPRLPIDGVRRILDEVADALHYAHERGVVHRDIKPDNLLLEQSTGRAIVTDFGIARAAAGDARLTVTGVAVGTPAYMSPEQALGERELDGRSDLYSLGVVGYQMLVGQTPFIASNTPAMLVKHVSEVPRPVRDLRPDVPESLAHAIDRALAKRPEDRWTDAGSFRDAVAGSGSMRLAVPDSPRGASAPSMGRPAPNGQHEHGSQRWDKVPARSGPNPSDDVLPALPPLLAPPIGMGRREWRRWAREQQRVVRAGARAVQVAADHQAAVADLDPRSVEARVRRFRRAIVRTAVVVPTLFVINFAMQGFPWFLFPSAFLVIDVFSRAGALWADGISPWDAIRSNWRARIQATFGTVASGAAQPALPPDPAAALVPADVLQGPHGGAVRRAVADRAQVREIIAKLSSIEKEMLPDVTPTIDGLVERVASIAVTVHRLDADVSGASLAMLDERIAGLQHDTIPESDRRLTLLQRQRSTLHDLLERRRTLVNQLESAGLALQNLKLDLLKLRSAGVGSALEDVTSATREARALSRDIGHLLDAASDVRKL